jgi:hypothetical protein
MKPSLPTSLVVLAFCGGSSAFAAGVLYSQHGADADFPLVAQKNLDSSFEMYDAVAADDFVVPAGQAWTISVFEIRGRYLNNAGPSSQAIVAVWKDHHDAPGELVWTADEPTNDSQAAGNFRLSGHGLKLKAGRYWLSVQAETGFDGGAAWGWETQTKPKGVPAGWMNPGDGYGTGCTTFTAARDCFPEITGDLMFTIEGTTR